MDKSGFIAQSCSCIIVTSIWRDCGKICARTGSQTVGADFSIPVTILKAVFNCTLTNFLCMLLAHSGMQYSASEKIRANVADCKV